MAKEVRWRNEIPLNITIKEYRRIVWNGETESSRITERVWSEFHRTRRVQLKIIQEVVKPKGEVLKEFAIEFMLCVRPYT